jgi:DNA-binding NarL/FixJ family response regulator
VEAWLMNVIVADHHTHTRLGLEMLLNREPGVSVVGSVGGSQALLALAQVTQPDVIFLDGALPGNPTIDLISLLRLKNPDVLLILLCSPGVGEASCCSGEDLRVSKGEPPEMLLRAFRALRERRLTT